MLVTLRGEGSGVITNISLSRIDGTTNNKSATLEDYGFCKRVRSPTLENFITEERETWKL